MKRIIMPMPDQGIILQSLQYDPETGLLHWKRNPLRGKNWNTRWSGREAFTTVERGYRQGRFFGRLIYAHRLIWKMQTGEDPVDIDHINGDRSDNRWGNLRNVTRAENMKNRCLSANNRHGVHGLIQTDYGSWQAYIGHEGRSICLGTFGTREDAVAARVRAETRYGYHRNHGREAA